MTAGADVGRRRVTRLLAAAGLAWGLALLIRPQPVVAALAPEFPPDRLWLARVLGGRLVVQHAGTLAAPTHTRVLFHSGIDLLHAASMVPLLRSPRYGRAARISGGVAAAYAAAAPAVAPRSDPR
ncbi:MAG TPA: hypothetical protein VK402_15350 [Blastococcus sp.]|nr:hypothetical protein [Blastococcus sp.]